MWCILFNITAITKLATDDSHLWPCVCCYRFLALCDKRSLQSNHICKFGKFHCVQSAVILIHRSHLRLKTFKLQQIEMACITVSKTRLIVNHHSFGSYKTKQVKSSVNCRHPSMPHENNMIAKTITDFAFALIKAIPIIITIACRSSNKKQYSSSGAKAVFTRRIFLKQLK